MNISTIDIIAALEPFAEMAEGYGDGNSKGSVELFFTVADLRRAREVRSALIAAQGQAGKPVAQAVVYCVICIKPESGSETLHIFSTADSRAKFMDADERNHIAYDYTLDAPERHEEPIHDN